MKTFKSIKIKPHPCPLCGGDMMFVIEDTCNTNNDQTIHLKKRCNKCFFGVPVVLHDCCIIEEE